MPAITSISTYSWCCCKRNRIDTNDHIFSQGTNSSGKELGLHFTQNNDAKFYNHSYDLDITPPFVDTAVKSSYNHFVLTIKIILLKI